MVFSWSCGHVFSDLLTAGLVGFLDQVDQGRPRWTKVDDSLDTESVGYVPPGSFRRTDDFNDIVLFQTEIPRDRVVDLDSW